MLTRDGTQVPRYLNFLFLFIIISAEKFSSPSPSEIEIFPLTPYANLYSSPHPSCLLVSILGVFSSFFTISSPFPFFIFLPHIGQRPSRGSGDYIPIFMPLTKILICRPKINNKKCNCWLPSKLLVWNDKNHKYISKIKYHPPFNCYRNTYKKVSFSKILLDLFALIVEKNSSFSYNRKSIFS